MRGLIAAVVLALSLPAVAQAARAYTVSIGNNLGRASELPLRYAERDAEAFSDVLLRLGDTRPENTIRVLGRDASAVRRSLLQVNARIRRELSQSGEEAVLLVFYSGHADAEGLHLGRSTLSYDELRSIVAGSPARVRVLILDGCRSGGLTRVKGAKPVAPFAIELEDELAVEGLAIITSSTAGEDSHESDRLGASFFSHHFVGGLLGAADDDSDGRVTLNEAYAYAYRNTLQSSGRTTQLQHPTYAYDIRGRGELVLTRLDRGDQSSATLRLPEAGRYLLRQGGGRVLTEVEAPRAGTPLRITPGGYLVQWRSELYLREYEVVLEAGTELDLSQQRYTQIDYVELLRKGEGGREQVHGIYLYGGVQGALLEGLGEAPMAALAYSLDLRELNLGMRFRYARRGRGGEDGRLPTTLDELGLGLSGQRFFDLRYLQLGVGLLAEGVFYRERFDSDGVAPDRTSFGAGVGPLLTFERQLAGALSLRLEFAPMTQIIERAEIEAGRRGREEVTAVLSWWAGLGLGWWL